MDYKVTREERYLFTVVGAVSVTVTLDGPTYRWLETLSEEDKAMLSRVVYDTGIQNKGK